MATKLTEFEFEKQLKKALRKGTKNHAKKNGKGSNHLRTPLPHNIEKEA